MNTRTQDLNQLEEARDAGNHSAKVALERAYKQSKDSDLERIRRKLYEATYRNDLAEISRLEELIFRYGGR